MTRARRLLVVWDALLLVAVWGSAVLATPDTSPLPPRLQDTGLYSDWVSRTVDPRNLAYSPQYPLWTDGAVKTRWFRVPAGKWIDARDPDRWVFPVGTRFWKEFSFNGRPVETRLIERTTQGWRFAAYQWNAEGTEARLAPELGVPRSVEIKPGIRHSIPSRTDCLACHAASATRVLGLNALQLSSDRDPNAPHATALGEGEVDLDELVRRGLVRGLPRRYLASPPRIEAQTATARAALGYLNTNCGMCHNETGELASLGFALRYRLGLRPEAPAPAVLSTVGHPSKFQVPNAAVRIAAGNPDASVLVARMSSRNPVTQMPPLGTHLVDDDAVRLIRQWIATDLAHVAVPATIKEKTK